MSALEIGLLILGTATVASIVGWILGQWLIASHTDEKHWMEQ